MKLFAAILAALAFAISPDAAMAREEKLASLGCILAPSKQVKISSAVPGVLEHVAVDRGTEVRVGQVLFLLEAGVERETLELARLKAEFAERKSARNRLLYNEDILTEHERDEIETEQRIASKELDLRQRELDLRIVGSPVDGVVINRLHHEGEYVKEQPVLELATLDPLHVDLLLPMSYFGKISVGQKVRIRSPSIKISPDIAWVDIVDPIIDSASGTFRVQLRLPNPSNRTPAGVRCNAALIR